MVDPVAHWIWVVSAAVVGFVTGAIITMNSARRVAEKDDVVLKEMIDKQRQHIWHQADYIRAVEIEIERYRNSPKILSLVPDEHAVVRGSYAFPWQERGSQN